MPLHRHTILPVVLSAAALLPAAAATAATVTVSTTVNVTQSIYVDGTGDPSFQDPFHGTYPFWDEYRRILTDEANVWDASQIPSSPPSSNPDPIESSGQIGFSFSFDPASLNTAALQTGTFDPGTGSGATSMGVLSGPVNATITNASGVSSEVVPGPMAIYATNDFATGDPGIGTIDALFVLMFDNTRPDGTTELAFFAAGFADSYFESLAGGSVFDWSDAGLSYLEVRNSTHAFDGDPLFDEEISGFGTGFTVSGGAGGSGAGISPVPLPAGLPLLLAGLGGLILVRRRKD